MGVPFFRRRKDLELKLLEAQRKLRSVKMKRRERIESLGNILQELQYVDDPGNYTHNCHSIGHPPINKKETLYQSRKRCIEWLKLL